MGKETDLSLFFAVKEVKSCRLGVSNHLNWLSFVVPDDLMLKSF